MAWTWRLALGPTVAAVVWSLDTLDFRQGLREGEVNLGNFSNLSAFSLVVRTIFQRWTRAMRSSALRRCITFDNASFRCKWKLLLAGNILSCPLSSWPSGEGPRLGPSPCTHILKLVPFCAPVSTAALSWSDVPSHSCFLLAHSLLLAVLRCRVSSKRLVGPTLISFPRRYTRLARFVLVPPHGAPPCSCLCPRFSIPSL